MSMHPPTFPGPLTPSEPTARGLAIASVVCGAIGLLFVPIALVALVLGIVAMVKISRPGRTGPQGLAITGTILGGLGIVAGCVFVGIMLPALGSARNAARQLKSGVQMRSIVQGMFLYSQSNKDWFPPKGSDWQGLLVQGGYVSQDIFVSPAAIPGEASYYYVSPGQFTKLADPSTTVVLVENPKMFRGRHVNVCTADGAVKVMTPEEFWPLVEPIEFDDGTRLRPAP